MYKKRDFWIAGIIFVLCLLMSLQSLYSGQSWGDDFAAYLSEGIAMADGTLDEQIKLNVMLHQNDLVSSRYGIDQIMYVRGVPAVISVIYRIFGLDIMNAENGFGLIPYKIPNVLCAALAGMLLYLFFRLRFGTRVSVLGTLWAALNVHLLLLVNSIGTDVPFYMLTIAALLLMGIMLKKRAMPLWMAATLGIVLWLAVETRLNGKMLVLVYLVAIVLGRLRLKDWKLYVPAVMGLGLYWLVNRFCPEPTSNAYHIMRGSVENLLTNMRIYAACYLRWAAAPLEFAGRGAQCAFGLGVAALTVMGMLKAWRETEKHLIAFLLGTAVVVCILPYDQGMRYIINVLPFTMYFAIIGLKGLVSALQRRRTFTRILAVTTIALLVCGTVQDAALFAAYRRDSDTLASNGFNRDAVKAYQYILDEVPEDAVIVFAKPRLLYLVTKRKTYTAGAYLSNIDNFEEPDYYLSRNFGNGEGKIEYNGHEAECVFQSGSMALYKLG